MSKVKDYISEEEKSLISINKKRVLLTVLSFFLVYFVTYLVDPFAEIWDGYFQRNTSEMLLEWGLNIVYSFIISEFSIILHNELNGSIGWERPFKRLLTETSINLVVVLLVNIAVDFVLNKYLFEYNGVVAPSYEERMRATFKWISVSVLIALMIMGINMGIHLITNWRNESLRVARLHQSVLEAELHALKLQIDPHFVFNNLSVLSELILEDQQLGYEYSENFSKIYRYLVVNSKKDIIPLSEELRFLQSYIFLIKHRFGEGVIFDISIDPAKKGLGLPPLTLQLLVENTLKHNQTSKRSPLLVKVYTNEVNELIVENELKAIDKNLHSSGVGTANIIKRYALLSDLQPQIVIGEGMYKVILPLLQIAK